MSGNGTNNVLIAPERNNFFYGKLMDVPQFDKDYAYALQKRLLLNRFAVGSGVLFGLDVAGDASNPGQIVIQPGAALDALGREIIVAQQVSIDPHQPTDDQGNPSGTLLQGGAVVVGLLYAEKKTDMVPKLVADCSGSGKCDWNTVREGYHVVVRQTNDPLPSAPSCSLSGGFPLPAAEALQQALSHRISAMTAVDPADLFLPLARVDLGNLQNIDSSVGRPLVYGNRTLYDLILCLSDRVTFVAQARILRYVSGDGQSATAQSALAAPLVVKLVDSSDQGVSGQIVQFQVVSGGGNPPAPIATDNDGKVSVSWTLGNPGPQQLTASAVSSVLTVTFNAIAT